MALIPGSAVLCLFVRHRTYYPFDTDLFDQHPHLCADLFGYCLDYLLYVFVY